MNLEKLINDINDILKNENATDLIVEIIKDEQNKAYKNGFSNGYIRGLNSANI